MKNSREITLVVAGIMLGATLAGPATQAAEMVAAQRSTQAIYVDGQRVQMEAYSIGGANYVRLRDVGKAVGFNVSWDGSAVQIDSNMPYAEETPAGAASVIQAVGSIVVLPTDGSKYVPRAGDIIRCSDGYLYEITDTLRWENNVFSPGPLSELPAPSYDWSVFPALALPEPEARHYTTSTGEELFIRNLYETRRMQYTIYEALKSEPGAWCDGRPLAKVSLTIPAEDEPYVKYFWPWRDSEVTKHVHAFPSFHFRVEAWDYYHNGVFEETRYYIEVV